MAGSFKFLATVDTLENGITDTVRSAKARDRISCRTTSTIVAGIVIVAVAALLVSKASSNFGPAEVNELGIVDVNNLISDRSAGDLLNDCLHNHVSLPELKQKLAEVGHNLPVLSQTAHETPCDKTRRDVSYMQTLNLNEAGISKARKARELGLEAGLLIVGSKHLTPKKLLIGLMLMRVSQNKALNALREFDAARKFGDHTLGTLQALPRTPSVNQVVDFLDSEFLPNVNENMQTAQEMLDAMRRNQAVMAALGHDDADVVHLMQLFAIDGLVLQHSVFRSVAFSR